MWSRRSKRSDHFETDRDRDRVPCLKLLETLHLSLVSGFTHVFVFDPLTLLEKVKN